MDTVLSQFNNRDIALLAWLVVIIVALLVIRSTREQLWPLLKLVFLTKIAIGVLAVVAYVILVLLAGRSLGIWHWWMIRDTIWWFFGTALVVLFNINKAIEEKHYFRSIVFEGLKFSVVLTFILNLYVFNLLFELLLVPVLAVLAMLVAVAGTSKKYTNAKKLLDPMMALIGFGFIGYALTRALTDFHGFASSKTLEDFLLPITLTISVLPLIYAIALYAAYETLFMRVGFRLGQNEALYGYAKRQVRKVCLLRLSEVNRFSKDFLQQLGGAQDRVDVTAVTSSFKMRDGHS